MKHYKGYKAKFITADGCYKYAYIHDPNQFQYVFSLMPSLNFNNYKVTPFVEANITQRVYEQTGKTKVTKKNYLIIEYKEKL